MSSSSITSLSLFNPKTEKLDLVLELVDLHLQFARVKSLHFTRWSQSPRPSFGRPRVILWWLHCFLALDLDLAEQFLIRTCISVVLLRTWTSRAWFDALVSLLRWLFLSRFLLLRRNRHLFLRLLRSLVVLKSDLACSTCFSTIF